MPGFYPGFNLYIADFPLILPGPSPPAAPAAASGSSGSHVALVMLHPGGGRGGGDQLAFIIWAVTKSKATEPCNYLHLPSSPCCYVGTLVQILAGIETLGSAQLTDILWSVACMEVAKPSPESQQNQGHQQQQQGQGKGEGQGGQQQGQDGREAGANGASGRLISYRPPDSWMKLLFQVWKV